MMSENPIFSALCAELASKAGLVAGVSSRCVLPDEDVKNLRQAFVSIQLVLASQGYEFVEPMQRDAAE